MAAAGLGRPELELELRARGLAPRTATLYARTVDAAQQWCAQEGLDLATIPAARLIEYADTKPLTHASRLALRCSLRCFWELVERDRPPLRAIRVPPEPEPICKALEDDDARLLAKTARGRRDRAGLAVVLGLYTGMRREEIASSRWDWLRPPDSRFPGGLLLVTGKGDKQRRIPLHRAVVIAMGTIERSAPFMFPGRFGGHVSVATIWAWVRLVSEEAGTPVVPPHVLRHTALAHANDATGDLRAVQSLAGHAKPETTSRYTRASPRRLRAAVESLDY
jgi:integrase/recombinase XerC